jgi:hypothetical protein
VEWLKGIAAEDSFLGETGVGKGFLLADGDIGVDLGVQPVDAVDVGFGKLYGG